MAALTQTLRAPRTGQQYPTDMANSNEQLAWNRDNNINSRKIVFTDLVSYSSLTGGAGFQTYVVPAGFIVIPGEGFGFTFWGRTAATANVKTVGITFGGTSLIGSGALAANNAPYRIQGEIFLTSTQGWEFTCRGWANGAVILETEGQVTVDPTAAISIVTTYTAAVANGDVLQNGGWIEMFDQINYNTYR